MYSSWNFRRAIEDEAKARRRASIIAVRNRVKLAQRVRELEDELARVRLLAFALADVCLTTGLVTEEELKKRLETLDVSDGTKDGKLARGGRLPGESPPPPPAAPDPATRTAERRARPARRLRRRAT